MRDAAHRILALGPQAVVIKGGHLDGPPVDVLLQRDSGEEAVLGGERVPGREVHGTGCVFSAALAAALAQGAELMEAMTHRASYVRGASSPDRPARALPDRGWKPLSRTLKSAQ